MATRRLISFLYFMMCLEPRIPGLDRGYDYDVVNSDVILNLMSVKGGMIVLSDGMSYRMMLLPDQDHTPLEVLEKVASMVSEGATIIGRPPLTVPGLKDYPEKNRKLRIWLRRCGGRPTGRKCSGTVTVKAGLSGVLLSTGYWRKMV